MRVFVYEHLTAIGLGRSPSSPEHGMYREGRAMRDALIADFARIPGIEVVTFPDDFQGVPEAIFQRIAADASWTICIAPETDSILSRLLEQIRAVGGETLGPSTAAVSLTSDKLALAEHWRANGVRTPATTDREPTPCEAFPVVWKPRYGAGSTATYLLQSSFDLTRAKALHEREGHTDAMILQEFAPGTAASVAFLCGPRGHAPLLPTIQLLSADGRFKYEGGVVPISPPLAKRATQVAQRAIECVPGLRGYVGVDLVLGEAEDGSRDVAIEINPRLTTSYIGLRAAADFNLAEAMLGYAMGKPSEQLKWKSAQINFGVEGSITMS